MTEDKKKKRVSDEIVAALINAAAAIIGVLIGVGFFPFLNPDVQALKDRNAELEMQLAQTISAPKNGDTWIDQNGRKHRYWICQGLPNWDKAKAFCETLGGHLATITSIEEQVHIQEYVSSNAPQTFLWIGVLSNNKNWNRWVSGEDFTYENWEINCQSPSRFTGNRSSLFANDESTTFTFYGDTKTAKRGEWLLFSDEGVQSKFNPDGWLICEWDYD